MNETMNSVDRPNATLAKVAGWLWITYGAVQGLGGLLTAIILGLPGGWILFLSVLALASMFAYIGSQAVRGKAKDTLGNGIGSIVFGLFGLRVFLKSGAWTPEYTGPVMGFALLPIAGLIALIGRSSYKQWRATRQ